MATILRPILVGGGWGLALGVAVASAAIFGPGLKRLLMRAAEAQHGAADRAAMAVAGTSWHLQEISAHDDQPAGAHESGAQQWHSQTGSYRRDQSTQAKNSI